MMVPTIPATTIPPSDRTSRATSSPLPSRSTVLLPSPPTTHSPCTRSSSTSLSINSPNPSISSRNPSRRTTPPPPPTHTAFRHPENCPWTARPMASPTPLTRSKPHCPPLRHYASSSLVGILFLLFQLSLSQLEPLLFSWLHQTLVWYV